MQQKLSKLWSRAIWNLCALLDAVAVFFEDLSLLVLHIPHQELPPKDQID